MTPSRGQGGQKNMVNVWKCARSGAIVQTHRSGMKERSIWESVASGVVVCLVERIDSWHYWRWLLFSCESALSALRISFERQVCAWIKIIRSMNVINCCYYLFVCQGLQGLALDRVLDIHKLFTAGTNKREWLVNKLNFLLFTFCYQSPVFSDRHNVTFDTVYDFSNLV